MKSKISIVSSTHSLDQASGSKRIRRVSNDRKSFLWTSVAILVSLLFILPALWMLVGSFRPSVEIMASLSPLSWSLLFPESVSLDNYAALFRELGFGRSLFNSFVVCIVSVAFGVVMSSMAAYALAVLRFRGRGILFAVVVISFMVPFEAIAIPLSQLFTGWGLANTYIGLILPGIGNGLAIFNLRQHFMSVPVSTREAAMLDGASEPAILARIYLPQSGAALLNSGLLIFLGQWAAYLWPLLLITDQEMQLAPVALAKTFGERATDYGQNFAGAVLLALVPALVMFVLQRFITGTQLSSGEK